MSSSIVYSQAVKLKTDVEASVNLLLSNQTQYSTSIKSQLEQFSHKIGQLDELSKREPVLQKRTALQKKIEGLREEHSQLHAVIERSRMEMLEKQAEIKRVQLLGEQKLVCSS
jgi:hypothetical protein